MNKISSGRNEKVRKLIELREKSSERRKQGVFVLEGRRELRLAIKNGYHILELFYKGDEQNLTFVRESVDFNSKIELTEVTAEVYEKIAMRGSTEGVIALVNSRNLKMNDFTLTGNPLILIAESVEKPGNFGALLRTADAAGLDAVILCDPLFDLYNPNVIRASLGCLFSLQVALCTSAEAIKYLDSKGINYYSACTNGAMDYTKADYTSPSAIVVGAEAKGLSSTWTGEVERNITIKMSGEVDSLNVSVSAAIIIFEALRQRKI